jgi:hypothetical protein
VTTAPDRVARSGGAAFRTPASPVGQRRLRS